MKVRRPLQGEGEGQRGEKALSRGQLHKLVRASSRTTALGLAVTCFIAVAFAPAASAARIHPAEGVLGSAAQPSFSRAGNTAVDAAGDVLVIDISNRTISRYAPDGTPANFSALNSTNVIDGHAGEADEVPGFESILGNFGNANEVQVAVDTSGGVASGDIYVTDGPNHVIDIFNSAGKYLGDLSEFGGTGLGETIGVAVDSSGAVYVSDFNNGVHKYVPTTNPPTNADFVETFTSVPFPATIAAGEGTSAGSLFVSSYVESSISKISSSTGTFESELSSPSFPFNPKLVAVDPVTGDAIFNEGSTIFDVDASGATPKRVSIIRPGSIVTGLGTSASGQVYVSREGEAKLEVYGPPGLPTPLIENQHLVSATGTEAIVEAQVDPEGFPTTVRVEYGLSTAYESSTPAVAIGEDESLHSVRVNLQGLTPGQLYHFRFAASNSIGPSAGPDQTLGTSKSVGSESVCPNSDLRTGPAARLLDCRAYEMVTPVEKNNLDISTLLNTLNNEVELNQSATSGEKITYTTLQGLDDTQGVPYVSQYIASRSDASGWSNQSITPPQGRTTLNPGKRLELEFQLFSPDLCLSLLNHYTEPLLAPGAFEEQANTYRRKNCGEPTYETVSTVPQAPGEEQGVPLIQGLSEDERCALFVPPGGGLYENCAGQTKQINFLPDGSESSAASAGSAGANQRAQELTLRTGNYQHAMSSDGSRVYWSSSFSAEGAPLYVRENAQKDQSALGLGDECLEPSMACTIPVSEAEKSYFWGASPDGARAIYSVGGNEQKLYEFNLETDHSSLVAGEVLGVMGVDEQANRTYFVSLESLEGQGAAGKPNLYLFDSTKAGAAAYKFIATVSQEDGLFGFGEGKRLGMVQQLPIHRVARVSPDGLHAVFASYAPLTGYDNTDAASGKADFEVFVYDALGNAGAGSLTCISCNPSGQRPHGIDVEVESEPNSNPNWAAALVPPFTTSFYGPRAMSDNGQRVFFDSYDALRPADTNGKEDVYEWEAPGSGPSGAECTQASASFSPPNGGCLALISSGESSSDSEFVDASPDGRDVFFKTASSLVPQDPGQIDIYDAREEGGFPPPVGQSAACEGEACQSPGAPPTASTASSTTFSGPGNSKPKKCPKGKVRSHRNGNETCIKKHKKKHRNGKQPSNAKQRAKNDRRAAR